MIIKVDMVIETIRRSFKLVSRTDHHLGNIDWHANLGWHGNSEWNLTLGRHGNSDYKIVKFDRVLLSLFPEPTLT